LETEEETTEAKRIKEIPANGRLLNSGNVLRNGKMYFEKYIIIPF
jgi:hypothetical protein